MFDARAASQMGIGEVGLVVIMIHSGSRGLGHQVAPGSGILSQHTMSQHTSRVSLVAQ